MYPEEVKKETELYLSTVSKIGPELTGSVLEDVREYVNEHFFQKFISGEDIEISSLVECIYLDSYITSRIIVEQLKNKGLCGLYRDEDSKPGEDIIYITDKGKDFLNNIFKENTLDDVSTIAKLHEHCFTSSFNQ